MTRDNDMILRIHAVQATQVGPSDEWSNATKSGYNQAATDIAMNILKLPAAPVTVGVKALPWVNDNWHSRIRAKTTIGDYVIWWRYKGECARLRLNDDPVTEHPTLEAAKVAAQADYATRILAALDVQPAPDVAQIRADALREAVTSLQSVVYEPSFWNMGAYRVGDARFHHPLVAARATLEALIDTPPPPVRCAECDCAKGGNDCTWIAPPPDAMAELVAALVDALENLRDLMCEGIEDDDGNSGCGQCAGDCTGCIAHAALADMKGGDA